jgi:DNA-binding transcriptional LysR family regulator
MDLKLFEDFIALSDYRNFSKAAAYRNSTQSAFSRRIQLLEAWAGGDLVDRKASPLALTPAGDAMVELAIDNVRAIRHAREEIAAIASKTVSTISFAVTYSLSLKFFPRWMHEIEKRLGPASLRLMSYDGERCRDAVSRGDCHFMISHYESRLGQDFEKARLRSLVLATDTLIPVTTGNPDRRPVLVDTEPGHKRIPYLRYTPGSFMGRTLDLFFQSLEAPPELETRFETSVAEGMKGMIIEGHGLGWLPKSLIGSELASGQLARVGPPEWDLDFEVRLFRPTTRLPKSAERLWQLVSKETNFATAFPSESPRVYAK